MFKKKYTITKSQLDKMNKIYNDMKEENERLKNIKENDDLLFSYEQEVIKLREENMRLKSDFKATTQRLKTSENTMSLVLKKLDKTMRTAEYASMVASLYKDMDTVELENKDLPFLR